MPVTAIPTRAGAYLDDATVQAIGEDWKDATVRSGDAASTVAIPVPATITEDKDRASFKSNVSYRAKNAAAEVAGKKAGYVVSSSARFSDDGSEVLVATFWKKTK